MQVTTNYQLPLYEPTDVANLLTGYNAAMNTLDTELEKVSQAAAQGATDIGQIQTSIGKINTEIEALQDEFTVANIPKIKQDISNLQTDVDDLMTQATDVEVIGECSLTGFSYNGMIKFRDIIQINLFGYSSDYTSIPIINVTNYTKTKMPGYYAEIPNLNYFAKWGQMLNVNPLNLSANEAYIIGAIPKVHIESANERYISYAIFTIAFDGSNTYIGELLTTAIPIDPAVRILGQVTFPMPA